MEDKGKRSCAELRAVEVSAFRIVETAWLACPADYDDEMQQTIDSIEERAFS